MALANFYEIMEGIIGSPANDYEQFILYTFSAFLGIFIILFIFQLFILITNVFTLRKK